MTFKKTNFLLLAISLSLSASHLHARITPENFLHKLQAYLIQNDDNKLPFIIFKQEEIEDQENLVAPLTLDPTLMMDPASAEETGKILKEKVLGKEASSETQKPADAFRSAVVRKAAEADEGPEINTLLPTVSERDTFRETKAAKSVEQQEVKATRLTSQDLLDLTGKAAKSAEASAYQLREVARRLEEATEAKSKGSPEISMLYLRSAEQEQVSAEYHSKAAEAYTSGNQVAGAAWDQAARSVEASSGRIWNEAYRLGQATETKSKGNPESATLYFQFVEQEKASGEYHRKAAEAYASGNQAESEAFDQAAESAEASGYRLREAVCRLEEATEAKSEGNPESAALYLRSAEQEKASAEYHRKAAEAYALGNQVAGVVWDKAAKSVEASADLLSEAAFRLEEATEAKSEGNPETTTLDLQLAEEEQALALDYFKAAQAYADGNNEEGDRFFQAVEATKD